MAFKIYHPEVETLGEVVDLDAYRQVWAPRGWELLGQLEGEASTVLGRAIRKLDDVKVDEYPFLIAARGLDPLPKGAKKAEYEKAFSASFVPVDDTTDSAPASAAAAESAPADTDKPKG